MGTCALPLRTDLRVSAAVDRDLDDLEGVLEVALPSDPTSWFLDDRRFRGFEYDVLAAFARARGLRLRVRPLASIHGRLRALTLGDVDLVAGRMPDVGAELVGLPLAEEQPVVLQSPESWCAGEGIEGLDDLQDRVVHVVEGSGAEAALVALGAEVRLLPDGMLLEQAVDEVVAGGGILVGRPSLVQPLLDAREPRVLAGATVPVDNGPVIALRDSSPHLHEALRTWLADNGDAVQRARARYLGRRWRRSKVVSAFDDLFRDEARRIGWRWPLLAAVAWQESRFRTDALSVAGAQGLMQIMPATAADLGLDDPSEPGQAIHAGARYLGQLERRWAARVADPRERLAFVLASYNAGAGHVEDAVALAQRAGTSGTRWSEVRPWMLKLADPTWNRRPEVVYGYCRGSEPVAYVDAILARWQAYEALLDPSGMAADVL